MAVDAAGNAYVTGKTASAGFPTTSNALRRSYGGGSYDAFVTKLNTMGSGGGSLVYSTYLGGANSDTGWDIAVDSGGNAYVTGRTSSATFPTTTNAYTRTFGGNYDAFVAKLDASGGALLYSSYLGGSNYDEGRGLALDTTGNAYVTGYTGSSTFQTTTGAYSTTYSGSNDVFVAKVNPSASGPASLLYSTYLGGNGDNEGRGVAIDTAGNAYVTGNTTATNFPTTSSALQRTYGGGYSDAFVTELNAGGNGLVYSTYLGGSGEDGGVGIAVDTAGSAYVTGYTSSSFPTTANAAQRSFAGGSYDAFVSKLNAGGSALVYSTYVYKGSSGTDMGFGIAVDAAGDAYVTGKTASPDFPTTTSAYSTTYSGASYNAFVSKLNPGGDTLLYSTYLGGGADDRGYAIAVDTGGNAYITGKTSSPDFPTTTNAAQRTFGGGSYNAFVSKLNPDGNALLYSTYLGGSGFDEGGGIAADAAGNAYVTGDTASPDFPTTTNAAQGSGGGSYNAFVTKLNTMASGAASLVYSTYLGGSGFDEGNAIAVDTRGNAYIAGETNSTNLITTTNVAQGGYGGGDDAFVAKVNPNASGAASLVYSTYLGGSGHEEAFGIAVDAANNAYVAGETSSTNFITTTNALQGSNGGSSDAFVSKLNAGGTALLYSTYLGGSGFDEAYAIAADAAGNAYVTGDTASPDFPTVNALRGSYGGGSDDAFVTKLNTTASATASLVYSTYLGGTNDDEGQSIAVDAAGNAYVAGDTNSADFPTLSAPQGTYSGGSYDAFVAKIGAGSCPSGWNCADIGSPSLPGDQSVTNGVWAVAGSGGDIWNASDHFHYVWQSVTGDSSLIVRLTQQQDTHGCAKAGVMYRAGVEPGAVNYAAVMLPHCRYGTSSIQVNYRTAAGSNSVMANDVPYALPIYLKVSRAGNTFSAYTSNDGASWTLISGSATTLNMPGSASVGLAVTSLNTSVTSTADFDHVVLTPPITSAGIQYSVSEAINGSIISGTTDTGNHCDDCTTAITLPFPYQFYTRAFTSAYVSSNGQLDFSSPADANWDNTCLPDAPAHDAIFGHWDDLRTDQPGGGVFTSVSGQAPNRVFNIEWRAVYYDDGSTINYEIRLYEGSPRFDIIYGAVDQGGGSATIGVQQGTGAGYTQYGCNNPTSLIPGSSLSFVLDSGTAASYTRPVAINSGGDPAGPYSADTNYSGGWTYSVGSAIDTSGVVDAAPQAVYQTERYGNFSYTVPNLMPGAPYRVRLHFAETHWTQPGQRVFNVDINGARMLTNFDIIATAGAVNKAIVEEFSATADSNGQIAIQYTSVVDNAKSSGIEIVPRILSALPTQTATAMPTNTPTNTPTSTPTNTVTATNTPTNTPINTATATNTPIPATRVSIDDGALGQTPSRFSYAGLGWRHCAGCNSAVGPTGTTAYSNTYSQDNTANDVVTVAFTGTGITLYGVVTPQGGIGTVSIADAYGGTEVAETPVHFYPVSTGGVTPALGGNQLLYSSPALANGLHIFTLRVTKTHDAGSTDYYVYPDRVDIIRPGP